MSKQTFYQGIPAGVCRAMFDISKFCQEMFRFPDVSRLRELGSRPKRRRVPASAVNALNEASDFWRTLACAGRVQMQHERIAVSAAPHTDERDAPEPSDLG